MAELVCSVCNNLFDLFNHKPKELECGHILCFQCIKNFIETTGVVTCPNQDGTDYRDENSFNDSLSILEVLNYNQLFCYEHKDYASGFNKSTFTPVCSQCQNNPSNVEKNNIPSIICQTLFCEYNRHKKLLSKEIRNIVKEAFKDNLHRKIVAKFMISQYVESSICCTTHPNRVAAKIRTDYYKLLCDQCSSPYDSMLISSQFIQYYVSQIQSLSPENYELITHTIAKYINKPTETSQPYIEIIEMYKEVIKSLDKVGCQSCGKLYHLGRRMPMKLGCNHVICNECSTSIVGCFICQTEINQVIIRPIESLYQSIFCSICSSLISINNLPFHKFCDCIICARCVNSNRQCEFCTKNNELIKNYYPKIHKRSLKALFYLNFTENCENCGKNEGILVSKQN